jgi:hypothetical protein
MKIQLFTLMAGPKGVVQPGEIINLPAKKAQALIKAGYAQPVTALKRKKETATAPQRETRDDVPDEAPADEEA